MWIALLFMVGFMASKAYAEPINLPNLNKNATGTALGVNHWGLDVALPGTTNSGDPFVPGSAGIFSFAVRKDSAGPLAGIADGDATPILVDSNGNLRVSSNSAATFPIDYSYYDYTVPVTTGAWTQLVASLSAAVTAVEIFDSSGQVLELGVGGAGSETRTVLVFPGGNGKIPVAYASGARVSIRAVSANATVGLSVINFYQ